MTRGHQPGQAVIAGNRTLWVKSDGSYVPFDSQRYRAARPWARGTRRDAREFIV
jgi:hypothetical protein